MRGGPMWRPVAAMGMTLGLTFGAGLAGNLAWAADETSVTTAVAECDPTDAETTAAETTTTQTTAQTTTQTCATTEPAESTTSPDSTPTESPATTDEPTSPAEEPPAEEPPATEPPAEEPTEPPTSSPDAPATDTPAPTSPAPTSPVPTSPESPAPEAPSMTTTTPTPPPTGTTATSAPQPRSEPADTGAEPAGTGAAPSASSGGGQTTARLSPPMAPTVSLLSVRGTIRADELPSLFGLDKGTAMIQVPTGAIALSGLSQHSPQFGMLGEAEVAPADAAGMSAGNAVALGPRQSNGVSELEVIAVSLLAMVSALLARAARSRALRRN